LHHRMIKIANRF